MVLLGALPVAVLAGSPQRVALSALIAAAYVAGAAITVRRNTVNRAVLAYVGVAAAWMIASWLRARFLLHLDAEQLAYATSKTAYFVLIVLPMAGAVALMVTRAEDGWPAAVVQVALGGGVALLTVVRLGDHFLGADRYSWQGNLIALGTVVAIQPWPIRRFAASALLGVLGAAGVIFAGSRQAVVALVVALLMTAVYWAIAKKAVTSRYVLLPVVLVVLAAGYIGVTYVSQMGGGSSTSCHCVTDRIVSLESSAGDRDKLLAHGLQLWRENPILGTGLGSFAGSVQDSLHPGAFYPYPHNVPLEIASETGIVGLVLLMVPLLVGWAALFWNGIKRASAPVAAILAITAVFFTVANVSGDIPSDRGMWIFGLVAFGLGIDQLRHRKSSETLRRAA